MPGQGKKSQKRAAAAAGWGQLPTLPATRLPAATRWTPPAPKGAHPKGKNKGAGKAAGKGKGGKPAGKPAGKGPPQQFAGKQTWCNHSKRICFDHHIAGCPYPGTCNHCHECCPEPGCTVGCADGSHGIWCH